MFRFGLNDFIQILNGLAILFHFAVDLRPKEKSFRIIRVILQILTDSSNRSIKLIPLPIGNPQQQPYLSLKPTIILYNYIQIFNRIRNMFQRKVGYSQEIVNFKVVGLVV